MGQAMLRAMLGVCGAGLIALGVFGGQLLDGVYQTVSEVFEPDVVSEVVVASGETSVSQPELIATDSMATDSMATDSMTSDATASDAIIGNTIASDVTDNADTDTAVTASVTEPAQSRKLLIETENLTEVKASAKQDAGLIETAVASIPVEQPALPKEIVVDQVVKTTTGSGPSNTLYVMKDRVNLREGPSINHPIVLQLDNGQELMEFKRDGKWIHVGAYGTSGKIGWVHATLVSEN